MRYTKIIITSALTLAISLGCGDDFFEDEIAPANVLLGEAENLDDIEDVLFGTYWQMNIGIEEGGFSQPIPISMEWNAIASDAFTITDQPTNNYRNLSGGYFFYNRLKDHFQEDAPQLLYSICYTLISNLNVAIKLIEDPTAELASDTLDRRNDYNQYVGEIYGLRAYNYFLLLQLYGPKYRPGAPNDFPSIILKTENSSEFEDIFSERATLQEIFDLMISDLTIAAGRISSTKQVGRLNKAAIYSFLARIYLDMNDWAMTREFADLALQEGFSLEARPIDAFNHTDGSFSNEVIFEMQNSVGHNWEGQRHAEFVSENSPIRLSRWNWIERRTMGSREILGSQYTVNNIDSRSFAISHSVMREVGWMEANSTDLTPITQTDLRFQQLYHWAPSGTDVRMEPVTIELPQENFLWVFKDARSVNDTELDGSVNDEDYDQADAQNGTGKYDGRAHLPIIRVSEMILTRAIASLKSGIGDPVGDLNLVRSRAGLPPYNAGVDGDIETAIKNERAKELLGEGDRLFYLKAMQYDIPIGDASRRNEVSTGNVISFPYDDLFWDLPPNETIPNPNID